MRYSVDHYFTILNKLRFKNHAFANYKQTLLKHNFTLSLDEMFSWACCVLALKAAYNKNIGVGAILIKNNKIIYEACNEMFQPYFRSDGHPEMLVLSNYEAAHSKNFKNMSSIIMYSSLEPCPMCLTRTATTSVKTVIYIASHSGSGMANCINKLPIHWQIFCENLDIQESGCSKMLKKISYEIFNLSVKKHIHNIFKYKEDKTEKFSKNKTERFLNEL